MRTFETRPVAARDGPVTASLGRLSLNDFRNFEELDVELPPEGVAVVGPNGSGKTNLLEGIYYLEIFRSFRGASDRELVRFGQDVFRIEGEVRRGDSSRQLAAAYQRTGRRKKVERDGRSVDRFSDAIGSLGAVVFSLDDVEIVRGSPSGRRRFLDILLSLVEPGYVDALQRYRKVLSQRNEALKGHADPASVEPWTQRLVEFGARIAEARARWVVERNEDFGGYNARVSGGVEATMTYEPSTGWPRVGENAPNAANDRREDERESAPDTEAWERRLRTALEESADRERRREVTVVGPHRDDLGFRSRVGDDRERDLRTYGSGGQQRTAALALRLAEADTLRDHLGREPIYLLDDVFAELDRDRSRRTMTLLDEGRSGQVIVTTPKAGDLALRGGSLSRWAIRDGEILEGESRGRAGPGGGMEP